MEVTREYPDTLIHLTLYHCVISSGFPQSLEHVQFRWIHPNQISQYPFCPADAELAKEVKRVYEHRRPL